MKRPKSAGFTFRPPRNAFTLVEVMIALAIVSAGGLLLVATLGTATRNSGEIRSRDEAHRIEDVVRGEIARLPYLELYQFLREAGESADALPFYAYTYRGDPTAIREDRTPVPSHQRGWKMTNGFRRSDDRLFQEDLEAREDSVFRVRLTPFAERSEEVETLPEDPLEYEEYALRFFVEVFDDPAPLQGEIEWRESRKFLSFPMSVSR